MPTPYRDEESMKKVADYRKKKLSYREIAKIMEKDVKTVFTWDKYNKMAVGKLSTAKRLTVK